MITQQPLVSIIVPIYNTKDYIERCATSLFKQTYPNCEFIFVNDCTPDNSIELLSNTIEKFPLIKNKVQIINKKQNSGLPQARKTGFEHSNGEYIAHVDSDDWVEEDYIKLLVTKAIENKADMVWAGYIFELQNKEQICANKPSDFSTTCIISEILDFKIHSSVWSKLCKREIYTERNISFTTKNYIEDMFLTIQCVKYARKIAYLSNCKYHYCYNAQSITFANSKEQIQKRFEEYLYNMNQISSFLKVESNQYDSLLSKHYNTIKYALSIYYKGKKSLCRPLYSYYPESIKVHNLNYIRHFLLFMATNYGILFPFKMIAIAKEIKNILLHKAA